MRIVVIGGDAAGMSAASQIRRTAPETEVVVLEQTQDVSYGACGLPYKLPHGQDVEDLKVISAERFRSERGIDLRLGHRVERIDPDRHRVEGIEGAAQSAFELPYDRLIIATGARVSRPPIPGLAELWGEGVFALKTLEDGRRLKTALAAKPSRAAIIGGGYIGLETTENLREMGIEVTVLEALDEILPFLPEDLRARVHGEADKHGVSIRRGARVSRLARIAADGPIAVEIADSDTLEVDLVVAATGVRPNAEIASAAGLALGAAGSIKVDQRLFTSSSDILAAGDCADAIHGVSGRSVWIPLALRANRAGKIAGVNAAGGSAEAPPVMGTAVFKFFGLQVARTGLTIEEAREAGFDPVSASVHAGTRAHYYGGGGKLSVWLVADRQSRRLLGGAMVGPEWAAAKIDTVAAVLHAGMSVEQVYDMDLAYAPPFGPSWSPLLTCASQLTKRLA